MNIPNDERVLADFYSDSPSLASLHNDFLRYAATELNAMPKLRFGQHDPEGLFTPELFVDQIGIDASHHLHPIKQLRVVQELLAVDQPNIGDRVLADHELTAIVHDMGEMFSLSGDVIAGTEKDEDDETAKRHSVIRAIAPKRAEEIINRTEPILERANSRVRNVFWLSEQIGYVVTGSRAARAFLNETTQNSSHLAPSQINVLGAIATDVNRRTVHRIRQDARPTTAAKIALSEYGYLTEIADRAFEQRAPEWHAEKVAANLVKS